MTEIPTFQVSAMVGKGKKKLDRLDPDHEPEVGSDPRSLPQLDEEKTIIAPDPEKVREAERKRERETGHPKPQ